MKFFTSLLLLSVSLQNFAAADNVLWYNLRWFANEDSNDQFTMLSVEMTVPPLQKAGMYYLWPGLQDRAASGVFQGVLDGKTGSWWIGTGWYGGAPDLPWGGGFSASPGQTIRLTHTLERGSWVATKKMGSQHTRDTFALGSKQFNMAELVIELHDCTWDFGPLVWNNLVMVMNTEDQDWCTDPPDNLGNALTYTMTQPVAVTYGQTTTCKIAQIVFQQPVAVAP